MRKLIKSLGFISLLISLATPSFAMEYVGYVLRSHSPDQITTQQATLADLQAHPDAVNIIVSQAYQVDQHGVVWGFVDPAIAKFAREHHIKVLTMITNAGFDTEKTHKFLSDASAEQKSIQSLIDACLGSHYAGVQFDFEMVSLEDRDALTHYYQTAAAALHKNGLMVSYAIAPVVSDNPPSSDFLKRLWTNWEGAYDLAELGKSADFVSVMAYNQHGDGTTPGPTASIRWVDNVLQYALKFIPAQKISLGILSYSGYWYTGTSSSGHSGRITTHLAGVSYNELNDLLQKYQVNLQWDDKDKNNYARFETNWLDEYLFVEDAKSFQAKLDLAGKYHLRGISEFYLGTEDPKTWDVWASQHT